MTTRWPSVTVPRVVEWDKHCELWLYLPDGSRTLLSRALDPHVEIELFGNRNGTLTFSMPVICDDFTALNTQGRKYVQFVRLGVAEASYRVVDFTRPRTARLPGGVVQFTCAPLIADLDPIIIMPDKANSEINFHHYGTPDDIIKELVRRQVVEGYAFPDGQGNARGLDRWTVAADKSEHPEYETTLYDRGSYLSETILNWACAYDFIDFDAYIVWDDATSDWCIEFQTWYPRRGEDHSRENIDKAMWVLLNDAGTNLVDVNFHEQIVTERNTVYDPSLDEALIDTTRRATHGMREIITERGGIYVEQDMLAALATNRVLRGVEYKLYQNSHFKYGQHVRLGDKITTNSVYFGTDAEHLPVKKVTYDYPQRFENIVLDLGDPEPDMTQKNSGSGGEGNVEDAGWAKEIKPVAPTNIVGTEQTTPRGDHQHRFVITSDETTPVDVGPDALGAIKFLAGTGMIDMVGDAANHTVTFNTVWTRAEVCTAVDGLHPTDTTDMVLIGAATSDGDWADVHGTTMLQVDGNIRVGRLVYNPKSSLALFGYDGRPKVHITDDGYYGGAALLDVYADGGTSRRILWDADDNTYSYVQGLMAVDQIGGGRVLDLDPSIPQLYLWRGCSFTIANAASSGAVFAVDGATGNLWLDPAATTTLGGYVLTWPTSGAALNSVLYVAAIASYNVTLGYAAGIFGNPGTLTYATLNAAGSGHTHAVDASADVSAGTESLLKSTAAGYLTLARAYIGGSSMYLYALNASHLGLVVPTGGYISLRNEADEFNVYLFDHAWIGYPGNAVDLGKDTRVWRALYVTDAYVYGRAYFGSTSVWVRNDTTTLIEINAGTYVSFATGGSRRVTITAGNVYPMATATIDMGHANYKWKAGYFSGTVYAQAIYLSAYGQKTGPYHPPSNGGITDSQTYAAGNQIWLDNTVFRTSSASGYTAIYARSGEHDHPLV